MTVLSIRSLKNCMSSGHFSSTSRKMRFRSPSASSMSPQRSQKATSGSTIQNSARWRGVLRVLGAEGGAEGVGLAQRAGEGLGLELPADGQIRRPVEEIERDNRPSRLAAASFGRSSVVTWNISPAPSQSLAVMIGVWT